MADIIRIPCGIVNCYLVKQAGVFTLVDSGYKRDAGKIEKRLDDAGVSPDRLCMVFLTHGHIDHTGSARYFRQQYRLPLALNPLEDDPNRPFTGQGLGNRAIWRLTSATAKANGPIMPDIALHDGQCLREYGIDAKAIALPGHTAGSMGLLVDDGQLLCGDLFSYLAPPREAYVAEDTKALKQSVRRLKELGVTKIYPGHGKPFLFEK